MAAAAAEEAKKDAMVAGKVAESVKDEAEKAKGMMEGGLRRMTRKQRASVKKVAKALKAANKKAFRLAMTLKKKLRR
jgi:hypothetical protein